MDPARTGRRLEQAHAERTASAISGLCGRFCVGFLGRPGQGLDFEVRKDVRRGLAREAHHGITGG